MRNDWMTDQDWSNYQRSLTLKAEREAKESTIDADAIYRAQCAAKGIALPSWMTQ